MKKSVSTALGSVTKRREKALKAIELEIDALSRKQAIIAGRVKSASESIVNYNAALANLELEVEELEKLKATL